MATHYYCLKCAARLDWRNLDRRSRQVCPDCGWVYYPQLKVGAGVRVVQNDCLLLLRRQIEPFGGCWNLPSGYVEADESPQRAAEREALEEAGLQVEATRLAGAYYFSDDPRGNGLLLVYDCHLLSGQAAPADGENSAACFFSAEQLPAELAGGGHDQAIRDWQAAYEN
jgi:ADP-ribose pyrophosphatase YjhB (NUDIX family)